MIQRIQSIFLLGIIICMGAMLFLPLWEKSEVVNGVESKAVLNAFSWTVTEDGVEKEVKSVIYLAIGAIIIACLAGFELFSYKNRILQRKIGGLNALFMLALLGGTYFLISNFAKAADQSALGQFKLGFFLIMFTVVFNILANRFISRDERLVRSSDRMRD